MARKSEPEYLLKIAPYTDKRSGNEGFRFDLSTTKEFRSFMYDILAKIEVQKNAIRMEIHGLSAPQITIPDHGPASYSEVLYNLKGMYKMVVAKLNGTENTFELQFIKRTVSLTRKPRKSFIEIITTDKE